MSVNAAGEKKRCLAVFFCMIPFPMPRVASRLSRRDHLYVGHAVTEFTSGVYFLWLHNEA
jgi:hypothetical protein